MSTSQDHLRNLCRKCNGKNRMDGLLYCEDCMRDILAMESGKPAEVQPSREKSLREIQGEIRAWTTEQFKGNVSKDDDQPYHGQPLAAIPSLLGMVEEVGELCRVVARRSQGRGYASFQEAKNAKEDALADCMIFMCDYAGREDIDLLTVLNRTWEKVCKRRQASWAADKAKEAEQAHKAEDPAYKPSINIDECSTNHGVHIFSPVEPEIKHPENGIFARCRGCGQERWILLNSPTSTDRVLFHDGHGFGHQDEGETAEKFPHNTEDEKVEG